MDKQELKTLVAQLLREMDTEVPTVQVAAEELPDLTKSDLRQEYHRS